MSKFSKRVMLAALISATGFALTFTWYHYTSDNSFGRGDAKPVAVLVTLVNEVQRKQVTKLIWKPVSENETLYAGEAIRTGSNAEAAIQFLGSKTRIDLEPDSAIVLEESSTGDLALNFISGNLTVKSDKAGKSGITLKTGDKNIALGDSEVSLGKGAGDQLDLQVLQGQVEGQKQGPSIQLLTPSKDQAIYIDPEKRELVNFTWTPVNKAYQVYVEAGPTRNSVKPVQGAVAQGDAGAAKAILKIGRTYYRLVAKSEDPNFPTLKSPIFKNMVVAKTPPTLLAPENEERVAVNLKLPTIRFAWTNPSNFEKAVFELSNTVDMKKVAFRKEVVAADEYFLDIKTPGKYYWRVAGYLKGLKTPVTSTVQSFDLTVNKELPPPRLIKPTANEKVPYERIRKSGLTVEWEAVPGVVGYILDIKGNKGFKPKQIKTKLTKVRVKGLNPGNFQYTLISVGKERDENGRFKRIQSKASKLTPFELTELPRLAWADGKVDDEQYYLSLKPSATVEWSKGPAKTVGYQLRFTPADVGFDDETPSIKLSGLRSKIEVPEDGNYFVEVEALDAKGFALARTARRNLRILPAPLLPAPQFAEATPEEIKASGRGQARVVWQEVQGANQYIMVVTDPKTGKAKEYKFNGIAGKLRGLMPGDYNVSLKSVDEFGRPGPAGEERVLRVPATSDVRAPKVKGFKVK